MMQSSRPAGPGAGFVVCLLLAWLVAPLPGQCTNPWPAMQGSTGVEGAVSDMLVFDPDGPGPLGERVLVAGDFQVAGGVTAQNLAVYDPATRAWAPFGPGAYPAYLRLARTTNGDLYVGGLFAAIDGVPANNVARWDGSTWSALGAGVNGRVWELAALPAGGIVATGSITAAGGSATAGIARWDGGAWSSLGSTSLGTISFGAVVGMANGDLCAAVQQQTTTTFFRGVLRFDGATWTQVGGDFGTTPRDLLELPTGELLAGGQTMPGNLAEPVARWTGTTWVALTDAPFQDVFDLVLMPNGTLVAGGRPDSTSIGRVATWDGFVWTQLGDSSYATSVLASVAALATGELLVGGSFRSFGGIAMNGVARWNGAMWLPPSPGLVGSMRWLAVRPDGSLFAGATYGAVGESLVHRWNGVSWSTIGGSYSGYDSTNLTGLFAVPSGSLISGGQTGWGTSASPIVQRWSGSTWTTLATLNSGTVRAVAEFPNGDLVVGGQFASLSGVAASNVARFDGSTWSPMGLGLPSVTSLVMSPTGLLALTASSVLRWSGSAWVQVGLSQFGAQALLVGADGIPVLAGNLTGPDVLRWNGSLWAPLGNGPAGPVQSIAVLPNGDLVVGPLVDANNPARPLERWNGSSWAPLGGAVDATVHAMAIALNGDLLLSGDFAVANGAVRCRFARVTTSCPATVLSQPAGCSYWNAAVLAPNVLPWLGGMCRSSATNLPANSLAIVATGLLAAATPLTTLLPQASFGCTLLLTPDVLDVALPVAGRVALQFPVPNVATLLGATVRQQVLPVVIDTSGSVTDVRASNVLVFQVGSY